MELEKREKLIELYDLYSNLLTEKQKDYFENYYFDDLSLAEIAEDNNVSRNAIHDMLKKSVEELLKYEEKMNLAKKIEKIKELVKDDKLKGEILDIIWEE